MLFRKTLYCFYWTIEHFFVVKIADCWAKWIVVKIACWAQIANWRHGSRSAFRANNTLMANHAFSIILLCSCFSFYFFCQQLFLFHSCQSSMCCDMICCCFLFGDFKLRLTLLKMGKGFGERGDFWIRKRHVWHFEHHFCVENNCWLNWNLTVFSWLLV